MFEKSQAQLEKIGAAITTAEIAQQPRLWRDTLAIYEANRQAIDEFLTQAQKMAGDKRLTVIFTGAGTSDYVGDTIAPYLRTAADRKAYAFRPIATTDIVSAPESFLDPEEPTVVVSFARSGNSPESLAAVNIAREFLPDVRFLNITCAPEGKLAQQAQDDPDSLTLLLPDANDRGFAMTGSFTCMSLLATLCFDPADLEVKRTWVEQAATMGEQVTQREAEITQFILGDAQRLTYLGSGAFAGLAQEAQLKILELSRGLVPTSFDSSMGYRHGPKSFVDETTVVFVFVSNDPYTRDYDLDLLKEVQADSIARKVVAIQQEGEGLESYDGESFSFRDFPLLPAAYAALPFVMVGQVVALINAVKVDNTPDTPSPTGQVNRVVRGVVIHPFPKA
ncbi:tagatose-6-phosphate ketose isomerase [Corynebacterium yudongzhengii]|uniref:SIS domain-containing protein n=1 Tax=Corynebacterium yudongzhengii TaxID=2080740 RepID=A0A2U1T8X7_9CORY|nr:SIS domain-containing protein [Corynebacterium yudongzhengii]AWB82488.1 tagatose-6-phosphate ketose isomerase [Corynebacterium yudongzhengii]PWC02456.1 SIS domain-containing protein [Corynebacterium yudongzhengii]